VRDFLYVVGRQQPTVLVLEDLHWANGLALDLISLLMEGLPRTSLLLLCVYRPIRKHRSNHLGTVATQKCRERHTEIHLRELTRRESDQMLSSLLRIEDLPAAVRDEILTRAQGNPFFLEEVVASLIDAGIVVREGEHWRAPGDARVLPIPDTIQGVILSRVDQLDGELQHVLRVASVIGRVFRPRVMAAAIPGAVELERRLWELEDRALIYLDRSIPEREYSFRHVLVREAVHQSLLCDDRARLHRAVGVSIESLYAEELEGWYEQLAYHYEQAQDAWTAVSYLLKAGEKAKRSADYHSAVALLRRGLALLETLPEAAGRARRELALRLALGPAVTSLKGYGSAEAGDIYRRAVELGRELGDTHGTFAALYGLARFRGLLGDIKGAKGLTRELMHLAETAGDPALMLEGHRMAGASRYHVGELVPARAHFEQAMAHYEVHRHGSHALVYGHDPAISCLGYLSVTLWLMGYPDRAMEKAREVLDLGDTLRRPFDLAYAQVHGGAMVPLHCGQHREAQALSQEAIALSRTYGFPQWLGMAAGNYGWALAEGGEVEAGIRCIREGLATMHAAGHDLYRALYLVRLGAAYAKGEQPEQGLQALAEALAEIERTGEVVHAADAHRLQGELLLMAGGRQVEAHRCFDRALSIAREQGARSLELRSAMSMGRLWAAQGRREDARELLQGVYGWFTEGFDTPDLGDACSLLNEWA
jgi:tetratricopeptide (TPR) repeat protein